MQRHPRFKCERHLKFISTLPCLVTKQFGVQVAHVSFAEPTLAKRSRGISEKVDDFWVVPLSPSQHDLQHSMNERKFWAMVGIDPLIYALRLWSATGDYEMGCQVVMAAKGNGEK